MSKIAAKYKWNIVGHDKQKLYLQNALEKNRLAHAYLLVGPSGTGKIAFAKDAAKLLLGTTSEPQTSPDYYEINTGAEIKIVDIRALISRFSLSAIAQSRRVAVISGIENATGESLNALLKILEEPRGDAVFFLTAEHLGALPETIISRTQKLFFTVCTPGQIEKALERTGVEAKKRKDIVKLSAGRIGKAVRMALDMDFFEIISSREKLLEDFLKGNVYTRLKLSQEIAADESEQIKELLGQWLESPRLELAEFKDKAHIKIIYRTLSGVEAAISKLDRNANRKLVLDTLAISL